MTYMLNGKQYIVIAVSGGNYSGELIAYKLPWQPRRRARLTIEEPGHSDCSSVSSCAVLGR